MDILKSTHDWCYFWFRKCYPCYVQRFFLSLLFKQFLLLSDPKTQTCIITTCKFRISESWFSLAFVFGREFPWKIAHFRYHRHYLQLKFPIIGKPWIAIKGKFAWDLQPRKIEWSFLSEYLEMMFQIKMRLRKGVQRKYENISWLLPLRGGEGG